MSMSACCAPGCTCTSQTGTPAAARAPITSPPAACAGSCLLHAAWPSGDGWCAAAAALKPPSWCTLRAAAARSPAGAEYCEHAGTEAAVGSHVLWLCWLHCIQTAFQAGHLQRRTWLCSTCGQLLWEPSLLLVVSSGAAGRMFPLDACERASLSEWPPKQCTATSLCSSGSGRGAGMHGSNESEGARRRCWHACAVQAGEPGAAQNSSTWRHAAVSHRRRRRHHMHGKRRLCMHAHRATRTCVCVRLRRCGPLAERLYFITHGWLSRSVSDARGSGSRTSAARMKLLAPSDRPGGYATSCVLILYSVSCGVRCAHAVGSMDGCKLTVQAHVHAC